jgi:hypothetical protein
MQNGWRGSRARIYKFKNDLESSLSADLKDVGGTTWETALPW